MTNLFANQCDILSNADEITKDQWLEIRMMGLGGSDVGAIFGLSKYKTPFAVYQDKIGAGQPVEDNLAMNLGRKLEQTVADLFCETTGMQVAHYPYMLSHKQYPHMMANLDRLVLDDDGNVVAGLECKTALSIGGAAQWAEDAVPYSYLLQCYHYMIVTGLKRWYIAAITAGPKFVYHEIVLDEDIVTSIVEKELEFWQRVIKHDPPMVTGDDIYLIEQSFVPAIDHASVLALPESAASFITEYQQASTEEKEAKGRKDNAKAQLCQMLAGYDKGVVGNKTVSWTPVTTSRLDTDRIKKEAPHLYEMYAKTDTSRRFSIK